MSGDTARTSRPDPFIAVYDAPAAFQIAAFTSAAVDAAVITGVWAVDPVATAAAVTDSVLIAYCAGQIVDDDVHDRRDRPVDVLSRHVHVAAVGDHRHLDLGDQHLLAGELGLLRGLGVDLGVLGDLGSDEPATGHRHRPERRHDRPGGVDVVEDRPDDGLRDHPEVVGGRLMVGGPVEDRQPFPGVFVAEPGLPPVDRVGAGGPVLDGDRATGAGVDLGGGAAGRC